MSSTSRGDHVEDGEDGGINGGRLTAPLGGIISPAFQRLQSGQSSPSREPSRSPLSQILHEQDLFDDVAGEEDGTQSLGKTYQTVDREELSEEEASSAHTVEASAALLERPETPLTPEDTPSRRPSLLSSPGSSSQISLPKNRRPGSLQPFDRRFSSQRNSTPSLQSPRASSPSFLAGHSRQSSLASLRVSEAASSDEKQPPWEVVRWVKLKKLAGLITSEVGKRNHGRPTCLAVANQIVIGTSKGLILVFDYQQNLVVTMGLGTKAVESGAVTSLAISADHSTIAAGHQRGDIFTWEIGRPAKPFLHIPSTPMVPAEDRTTNGHVHDKAVLHISFLGTRHTALVSADEGGMAFSHLATRGLGAVARVVKTVRILGRYPLPLQANELLRKPSSVLAFGALPLGNVEQATDPIGLTALLTPYLLVIVSTTPIAQTQHKAPRPKDVEPHSTLSGCLAWFPAVKLKKVTPGSKQGVSKTKLAYSWSNVLTVLDVDCILAPDEDKPPEFNFRPRNRWKADEAIVGLQWLSRSVLAVLTISQRLIILEDNELRVTDSYDLMHKHIFHNDLFSRQLRPVVEQLNEDDNSMHGVVADAFYMSFRAYKGRLFLLGFETLEMGTLSNWADRLVALMEEGNYIAAIELASAYYAGDTDRLTVGLPDDATARHNIVQERLLEMITASLRFTFSGLANGGHVKFDTPEAQHQELALACFVACTKMNELDFLFEEVYEPFADSDLESVFFETLEPYVLDETINSVPPEVLQAMISHYVSFNHTLRLEDMLCRLDTSTLNIDHTLTLCKQYQLFNALIYIYNRALSDYVSPLTEMLMLTDVFGNGEIPERFEASIMKMFPYLALCLTGRYFPGGEAMEVEEADKAKAELYRFLFSGRAVEWPPGSGKRFLEKEADKDNPSYPYLTRILHLDASSFLSVLNEAFEDNFLNGHSSMKSNGALSNGAASGTGLSSSVLPTRQTIISILLEVMAGPDFLELDTIYLDMFIARNLPKFPQFIFLPGSSLQNILEGLCHYPSDELASDCELSVEYLLSQYNPSDLQRLTPLFEQARFYRVLKSVYRGEKEYAKLLQTCFADTESLDSIFENLALFLRPTSSLTNKQLREVYTVVVSHAYDLATIDAERTSLTLALNAPSLFEQVLAKLPEDSLQEFSMLRTILEPESTDGGTRVLEDTDGFKTRFEQRYVQLMCKFDPTHVASYVNLLKSGDLQLDRVLPAMEASGVVDAAVVLMARDGMVQKAMTRLLKHLSTLQNALASLILGSQDNPDSANLEEATEDLLQAIDKYSKVGIWLCQGQSRSSAQERPPNRKLPEATAVVSEADLELDEELWLEFIDAIVNMSQEVSLATSKLIDTAASTHTISTMRNTVQQVFSALLVSTTSFSAVSGAKINKEIQVPTRSAGDEQDSDDLDEDSEAAEKRRQRHTRRLPQREMHSNPSFLLVLRAFLSRASARLPTLSDLRAVLADVFAAYSFEAHILELANQFLDKDVFVNVAEGYERRVTGWRSKSVVCEVCGRRVWGPGTGAGIWDAWEEKRQHHEEQRKLKIGATVQSPVANKGKGKSTERDSAADDGRKDDDKPGQGPLVVFACGHVAHKNCLGELEHDGAQSEHSQEDWRARSAYKCPVDG